MLGTILGLFSIVVLLFVFTVLTTDLWDEINELCKRNGWMTDGKD